jgi:nucleoside-diphosphate-sugar epimerase
MTYITGSSGFVGNAVCQKLLTSGAKITTLGREDLKNTTPADPSCSKNTLIHTAWEGVPGGLRNADIQNENILLCEQIIRIMSKLKITRLIAFGSQAEYGPANQSVTESFPANPSTLYGKVKLQTYHRLKQFCEANNIEFIWLRLFDPYGPGDKPCWLLPYVTRCMLKDISPMLTSCTQIWDYIHIFDVANCVQKLISTKKPINGIFNLSSNRPVSLRSVVSEILIQINPPTAVPQYGAVPHRQDQIYYLHGINDKLCNTIDWCPSVSLEEGIRSMIIDQKERLFTEK